MRRRVIELPELPGEREEPRDDLAQLADRDELERAFLELSVEHRTVLVLTHYVGLPASEIGQILGIPRGTVASRLHYGARAMRAALDRTDAVPSTIAEPGR
jgi:RNA polymerase sigma-70 factor (ECF subfamily)